MMFLKEGAEEVEYESSKILTRGCLTLTQVFFRELDPKLRQKGEVNNQSDFSVKKLWL